MSAVVALQRFNGSRTGGRTGCCRLLDVSVKNGDPFAIFRDPGFFRVFDFASPDQTAERRPQTTVPQQALFAMNSPFVIEQAKALAARPEVASELDVERRDIERCRAEKSAS